MSFTPIGRPRSGPVATAGSCARRRAASRSRAMKAPISFSRAAITSAHLSSTAAGVSSPASMRQAQSSAESIRTASSVDVGAVCPNGLAQSSPTRCYLISRQAREEEINMARRVIDISVPLQAGIASDPPYMLPQIAYDDHHVTAPRMAEYMGVRIEQFPDGEFAAVERCEISTHNGTHLDAPYHYFSTMNHALKPGGEPSWRIDEVPLEWCFQPAVKIDFRHCPDGDVAMPGSGEVDLKRVGHPLRDVESVLANPRPSSRYGEADFLDAGCG